VAREWRLWTGKVSRVRWNGERFVERVLRGREGEMEREKEGDCLGGNE